MISYVNHVKGFRAECTAQKRTATLNGWRGCGAYERDADKITFIYTFCVYSHHFEFIHITVYRAVSFSAMDCCSFLSVSRQCVYMMPSYAHVSTSHWYAHSYAYQSMLMLKTAEGTIYRCSLCWYGSRRSLVCVHCIECDGKISTLSMRIVEIEVACRWNTQKPPQKMTRCAILSCASINTPIRTHVAFIRTSGERFATHFSRIR